MLNRSYINRGHEGHPHYLTPLKILTLQKVTNLTADEDIVRIIRNLSDPTKLKIYLVLNRVLQISVTDLKQILGMSHSAISHALSDLKNLGLVEAKRCGKCICYSLKKSKSPYIIKRFFNKIIRI